MSQASVATLWLMLLLLAGCAAPAAPTPPPAPTPRTTAVTWREVEVVPSARGEHAWLASSLQLMAKDAVDPQPWSYRVYLPTQTRDINGSVSAVGERPLILLNLLASIEWDADDTYLNDFEEALREASFYLWDVTDGQMAIGQARIVDNRANWWDADIRVLARNTEAPHASIDGMRKQGNAAAYRVQVGPFWHRNPTANPYGKWSASDGHRTLAHELGHYVLGLYDEYTLKNSSYTSCTTAQPTGDPHGIGASAMNWQYTTSELSAHTVANLWDDNSCKGTLQWEQTKKGAWETVVARFNRSPNWQVLMPGASADAGPERGDWPAAMAGIPAITVTHVATGTSLAPLLSGLDLTVRAETPPTGVSTPTSFDEIWLSGPGRCAISLGKATVGVPLPLLGTHGGDWLFVKKHMGSFHWCGEAQVLENGSSLLELSVKAQRSCTFVAEECSEDSPVADRSDTQFWLANLDPAFAAVDRATGRTQSGAAWISPDKFVEIVQVKQSLNPPEQNLEPPDLAQWAAGAAAALAEQGNAAPLVTGVGLCLPNEGPCTRLPVGVVAYTGREEEDGPAPLTFSSADGRLQVYGRGELRTSRLMILDSPPVTRSNGELRSVSRVYTLAGDWECSLQVQIQAECCSDANDENTPLLFRFADGEWHELGRPPFSPQESYVLATINEPGSYALFR